MKVTIELTDEELRGILITADGRGTGYWAQSDVELERALVEPILIRDSEDPDGEPHGYLTAERLRAAPTRMAALCQAGELSHDVFVQLFDPLGPEAIDSTAADVLVQVALFDEIKYG